MPRPGPRPYECVRRVWHSARHLPIRGSLIQELFRIVNEVHRLATRKNKEWQEKLPVVVLKAEEIMYSKADSEAEYVDFSTLWDRANDAINTIIRRDESTETGVLLQPCIEAALHLGCTPRKASRSQRNNTSGCYLNPGKRETPPTNVLLSNLDCKIQGNYAPSCPLIPRSAEISAANLMTPSRYLGTSFSGSCSVYPLYYGNQLHFEDPNLMPPIQKANINKLHSSSGQNDNKLHSSSGQNGSNVDHSRLIAEPPPGTGCNLSLRLGPLEVSSYLDNENDNDAFDKSLQCDDSNEFSFFPKGSDNAHCMPDCCSAMKWILEAQKQNADKMSLRKRKPEVSHPSEDDRSFCWPQKVPFKQISRTD